jgi:predicted O-methyltransferase YrrM
MRIEFKHRIKTYFDFFFRAKSLAGYGIHSPFVFSFATGILSKANKNNIPLNEVISLKKKLRSDKRLLTTKDYGAGSDGKTKKIRVSEIIKKASTHTGYCRLLFKIAQEIKPKTIIELGTSLGISTLSLSLASPKSTIHTIEGSDEIAKIAGENFKKFGLKNIIQYTGTFEAHIEEIIKTIELPVLIYIDGNHCYEPTMNYFNLLTNKIDDESILIVDDIHWSEQMSRAWHEICENNKTTIKLDLYRMGNVFFRSGLPKKVFNICF